MGISAVDRIAIIAKKVVVLNEAKTVVAAYESSKVRINSNETSTSIKDLVAKNYLDSDSIKKIPHSFSVEQCKQLMDTENYNFNIESKYASKPEKISDTTEKTTKNLMHK